MEYYHKTRTNKTQELTRTALVGGCYFLFTVLPPFSSIAYGPIQVRVSEALTVLPFFFPETMWGLTVGCFLANIFGGVGVVDFLLGPLFTLFAGYLTSRVPRPFWAPLPPVLINGFGVPIYLSVLFRVPYFYAVFYVIVGEIIACYGLGWLLILFLRRGNFQKGVKKLGLRK
ncbi:MAG: QueT transporter family protein [Atribacterota bacterium]